MDNEVDYYEIRYRITGIVAAQMHFDDVRYANGGDFLNSQAAQVINAHNGSLERYLNDANFHARVDNFVVAILDSLRPIPLRNPKP